MKKLIQLMLEISADNYEKMIINHYHQWCLMHSHEENDCQKLLANPQLFNWWQTEYNRLQRKFIKRAYEFHTKADKLVLRKYHAEIVAQVKDFYCKPLLSKARKQEPITPQFN
ncbi:hypothetical protein ML462_13920 [Gramella lutea]|uniref:Uncharacterized protein n=1 Tax=Christiangramia lutea TaxID=1607951 RepID=A0A9X1V4Z9_9FLAO|nr:hypothetical protein [Christiangramia lutea]MCH4824269.1 hypothetical protein [Christiangramia lutea]